MLPVGFVPHRNHVESTNRTRLVCAGAGTSAPAGIQAIELRCVWAFPRLRRWRGEYLEVGTEELLDIALDLGAGNGAAILRQ